VEFVDGVLTTLFYIYGGVAIVIALLILSEDTGHSIRLFWRLVLIFLWPLVLIAAICFCIFAVIMGVICGAIDEWRD
jgi:hypothetical protein